MAQTVPLCCSTLKRMCAMTLFLDLSDGNKTIFDQGPEGGCGRKGGYNLGMAENFQN